MSDTNSDNKLINKNNPIAVPLGELKKPGRQTLQRELAGLKHVKFKPENLTLLVNIGYWYEVDLERCNNSAQLLDWIFQVAGKLDRDGGEIVWEFLHALNLVSGQVFEHWVQGAFCPFGQGYEVDWKSGERREAK